MNLFSLSSSSARTSLRAATLGALLLVATLGTARADSIGISFIGGGGASGTLAATTSAGVVAQTNWNNLSGFSATSGALNNNSGDMTTTTLTYAATATGVSTANPAPVGGDEQLNRGVIIRNLANSPINFTLNNISYGTYDIYVYNPALSGTQQQTTLGTSSFFSTAPNPSGMGYIDGDSVTPYTYTRATGTSSANSTVGANYVRFSNLSGTSQSFTMTGLSGFGRVAAIQVVATPEPSTYAMMLVGAGALCLVMRRKRTAAADAL